MNLSEYAKDELTRAGLFDEDSDYNGMLGKAVMDLVEVFADQGHSGFSAGMTLSIFNRVASYMPLTPVTSDPDELFFHEADAAGGDGLWQSRRQPDLFSKDGGKTWYSVNNRNTEEG